MKISFENGFGNYERKKKEFHALLFSIIELHLHSVSQTFQGPIILVFTQPLHHGPFTFFNSIERALQRFSIALT